MQPKGAAQDGPEQAERVLLAYGRVMQAIQYWELAVALRWWEAQTPPVASREAESRSAAKAVKRLESAFTRVTAGQARRELEGHMPEELLERIGALIELRNGLAHRFLREQQQGLAFRVGTLVQLGEAGRLFDAALRAFAAEEPPGYDGGVRPHWPHLAETLGDRLFDGEAVDVAGLLAALDAQPDSGADDR